MPAQPAAARAGSPNIRAATSRGISEVTLAASVCSQLGALCQPDLLPSLHRRQEGLGRGRVFLACSRTPQPLYHLLGLVTVGCSRATTRGRQRGLFTRKLRLRFHPGARRRKGSGKGTEPAQFAQGSGRGPMAGASGSGGGSPSLLTPGRGSRAWHVNSA